MIFMHGEIKFGSKKGLHYYIYEEICLWFIMNGTLNQMIAVDFVFIIPFFYGGC